MVEYFTVSISFVLISAIAIMFFLNKKKMLKKNIVQAIIISTLSMILMSVLFPYITGYLMSFNLKFTDAESSKLGIGLAVAITLTLYFVIILFLSFLVSDMVWVKGVSEKSGNTENGSIVEVFRTALGSFLRSIYPKKGVINDLEAVPALESQYTGNNYHAQNEALNRDIYENVTNDTTQNDNLESGIKEGIDTDTGILWDDTNNSQTVNLQDTAGSDENILQKPVDREQNIDTIGVVTENSAAIINDENFNADSKADEGLPEEADSKNQYNLPLEQIADFFDTSDADSNDSVLEQPMISDVSVDEKDVIIDKEDEFEVNQDFFDEEIIKEIESVDEDNLQAGEDAINEAETIENIIDENTANEGVITEDVIDEDTITEDTVNEIITEDAANETTINEHDTATDIIAKDVIDENATDEYMTEEADVYETTINENITSEEAIEEVATSEDVIDENAINENIPGDLLSEEESERENIEEIENIQNRDNEAEFKPEGDSNMNLLDSELPSEDLADFDEQVQEDMFEIEVLDEVAASAEPVILEDNDGENVEDELDLDVIGDEVVTQADKSVEETINEVDKVDDNIDEINEYIDEAFKLKVQGDYEGAIINYMYALEQKPENTLTFWLVLDICTLYKQLGKTDLAKNILEGYMEQFGSVMNQDIKLEIEKNL